MTINPDSILHKFSSQFAKCRFIMVSNLFSLPVEFSLASIPYPSISSSRLSERDTISRQSEAATDYTLCSIVCMNCQELIHADKIQSHSFLCTTVTEEVRNIERSPLTTEIQFKLAKLESCLAKMQNHSTLSLQDRSDLMLILRLCQNLIYSSNPEGVKTAIKSILSVYSSIKYNQYLKLYTDRLIVLSKLMLDNFHELTELYSKREVKRKSLSCTISPKGAKISQRRPLYQDISIMKFENVSSEIGSLSSTLAELSGISLLYDETEESSQSNSYEEMQKKFYSLCLSLKIKCLAKHAPLPKSMKQLFEAALEDKIPYDKWAEFIKLNLQTTADSLPISRRRKRTNKSWGPQKFETIIEENINQ